MQDVGISTTDNREYLIRRFIRPALGDSALNSLSTEEITRWENGLPARAGISRRTARDTRSLLCTILGDAAAAKPALPGKRHGECPKLCRSRHKTVLRFPGIIGICPPAAIRNCQMSSQDGHCPPLVPGYG